MCVFPGQLNICKLISIEPFAEIEQKSQFQLIIHCQFMQDVPFYECRQEVRSLRFAVLFIFADCAIDVVC